MRDRRDRGWIPVVVVVASVAALASCGGEDHASDAAGGGDVVAGLERADPTADPSVAGAAISAMTGDVFRATRDGAVDENVTLSPVSIAIALAMVEPGATGDTPAQLRDLLHVEEPAAYHASMNALEQHLEARVAEAPDAGEEGGAGGAVEEPGELDIRIANAGYVQHDDRLRSEYVDAVTSAYGPVLREVDFSVDPDAVARQINDFIAEATDGRITDLVADGAIRPETVLALVNALSLRASWVEPFDEESTVDDVFRRLDGSELTVPMMQGQSASSARGDGWVGATKPYVGGLTAQFILPDEGRFDEVADDLTAVFAEYEANRTAGAAFAMPRFAARFGVDLPATLKALGLTAPFVPGGLDGIAGDGRLVIDNVVHQASVEMNEQGTEAAAATIVLMSPVSAPLMEPVPVTLDRPFLYRIVDGETGATLFVGQLVDPAGAR